MPETSPPSFTRTASRSSVPIIAAVAAFLLFFFLRAWPLDYGSPPIVVHADEKHYPVIAAKLTWSDLNPHYFENPPLFTYALFLVKEAHRLVCGDTASAEWIEHGNLILAARLLAALLGALTPFLVGAAAYALFRSSAVRVGAIAICGLSFLHGRDSHYGVNDVPMTFCVAASLMFAARGFRAAGTKDFVLAALCAGFAAATKYNGAIAFALAPAALLVRDWPRRAELGLTRIARDLVLLCALPFVAYIVANPYTLLDVAKFTKDFWYQFAGWGDRRIPGQSQAPLPLLYLDASRALIGVAGLLAALAGLVLAARRDRLAAALALLFPVLYLAGMLSKDLFFWRFALPLLPFLALFAGVACAELASFVAARVGRGKIPMNAVLVAILAGVTAEPAVALVRHDVLLTRPSTWMLARDFALHSLPKGSVLFLEGILVPDFGDEFLGIELQIRSEDLAKWPDPRAGGRPKSALTSGSKVFLFTTTLVESLWSIDPDPEERERYRVHYEKLRKLLVPLIEFRPGPSGDPEPYVLDAIYSPLTDLWSIDRPGFTIRVYSIDPAQYLRHLQQETPWARLNKKSK